MSVLPAPALSSDLLEDDGAEVQLTLTLEESKFIVALLQQHLEELYYVGFAGARSEKMAIFTQEQGRRIADEVSDLRDKISDVVTPIRLERAKARLKR